MARRWGRALLCVLAAALAAAGGEPPLVRCLRVGEGTVEGRLIALDDQALVLEEAGGAKQTFPLAEFREIEFPPQPAPQLPPPWTVWTRGGCLMARAISGGSAPETLSIAGYGWQVADLPIDRVRAVAGRTFLQGPEGRREEFERLRDEPPVAEDRVSVVQDGAPVVLSGVVEGATDEGLLLGAAEGRRVVPWKSVEWIVLATGAGASPETAAHGVELADGTRIPAPSIVLRDERLTVTDGGARYAVERRTLARIRVRPDAYCYLSDLKPEGVSTEPRLDVVWPPRFDESIAGGPIILDGRAYPKGIGMHPRTEMTFALEGRYARFYATVGVDDAAGDGGSVAFQVLADGRQVYESGPVTGADAARPVALEVGGVQRLTLRADFGDPFSPGGDFADWAEARLVRAGRAEPSATR